MSLRRRRLLAALGAGAGAGAAAGCLGGLPGEGPGATPTPRPADAAGCPDYDRRSPDRVVCSADPPDDSLVLEPDPETAGLPRATVDCRLENELQGHFETNYFDWTLHRHADGEWYHLGPYAVPQPLHRLRSGETHVRRLVVDNTDLGRVRPPEPESDEDSGRHGPVQTASRHGLGPGSYAVAISSSSEGPQTVYSAAFALEGDPVPLVEPETVAGTERDGTTRTVHLEPGTHYDLDRFDLAVRREPSPPREPRPLVDEQVYLARYVGLRAAFANLDPDAAAVEVLGDDSQFTRDLASGRGPSFVEYDGDSFQLQVNRRDE